MNVYVILETGYYHNDFCGVYSSEEEACKELASLEYPEDYEIEVIELDSNADGSLSARAKALISWLKNLPANRLYSDCDGEELYAIAQAVFKEFFD